MADTQAEPQEERPQFESARAMRFYLAGRYDRREQLLREAAFLECFGHISTARWLLGGHDDVAPELCAADDLEDIDAADLFITYTETPEVGFTSGGRHVELGYALAKGKNVAIVGERENVFMHLIGPCEPTLMTLIAHYGSAFAWVRRGDAGGGDEE